MSQSAAAAATPTGGGCAVYPVIHVRTVDQARRTADVAREAGADGVFLISMLGDNPLVMDTLFWLRDDGHAWVGVNLLGLSAPRAVRYIARRSTAGQPDALWIDDLDPVRRAAMEERDAAELAVQLYGGVAFKYTRQAGATDDEAREMAWAAHAETDVITTSGPGTGQPPTVSRLAAMYDGADSQPIAVASGVTADNLPSFRPYVASVLVGSSIETVPMSGVFQPTELRRLIEAAQ